MWNLQAKNTFLDDFKLSRLKAPLLYYGISAPVEILPTNPSATLWAASMAHDIDENIHV